MQEFVETNHLVLSSAPPCSESTELFSCKVEEHDAPAKQENLRCETFGTQRAESSELALDSGEVMASLCRDIFDDQFLERHMGRPQIITPKAESTHDVVSASGRRTLGYRTVREAC